MSEVSVCVLFLGCDVTWVLIVFIAVQTSC